MKHEQMLETYRRMRSELDDMLCGEENRLACLSACIQLARNSLRAIEAGAATLLMADENMDIAYFKSIHPMFSAEVIFYVECYNLEKSLQLLDRAAVTLFLEEELRLITRFFQQNYFLYEYYKLGADELDRLYFVPHNGSHSLMIPEFPLLNCPAPNGASHVFAQIMAYEKLKLTITERLTRAKEPLVPSNLVGEGKGLKWTGDTIDLVELAYGLYLTGHIGNGDTSLNRIVQWLGGSLGVELVHVNRRFTEITRRKRLSYTRFIDNMRDALHKRIEEGNGMN